MNANQLRAPMDAVTVEKVHMHTCHLCGGPIACNRPDCTFDDTYAVCTKPECIRQWEHPDYCEDCGYDPCKCDLEYLNRDSAATLGLEPR